MTAALQYPEQYCLVQVARTLPASEGSWITTTWIEFDGGSEGIGNQLGEIALRQHFGVRTDQGLGSFFPNGSRRRFVNLGQAPDFGRQGSTGSVNDNLAGAVVRILLSKSGGSVTYGGYTFEPFWWGIIRGPVVEPDGSTDATTGGVAGWRAVDIRSVLDQIVLREGWAVSPITSSPVRVRRLPPFNANPNGDRSAGTYTLPGGTAHAHQVSSESGSVWTASNIITYLLATAARGDIDGNGAATGWTWAISDPDGVLAYEPQAIDLHGLTVFQAINALADQDRGITWSATVSGSTVTLRFWSASASAITVGSQTLPASSQTTTLDIRGYGALGSCTLTEDWDSVYDVIEVYGQRPWITMTLLLDSSQAVLKGSGHGWSAALDSVWATAPTASGTEDVQRRWRINNAWNGQQYNQTTVGLRNVMARSSDGGYSGERSYDSAQEIPPAWILDFERNCCCSHGFGSEILAPRQPPVVVVGSSTWTDYSQQWSVQVDTTPPSIRIDDGRNGSLIQSELTAGRKILFTIGIREADPLCVSWHRASGDRPNATPRIKTVTIPWAQQWKILNGTVTGVTSGGALTTSGSVTVRDDVPALQQALALLVGGFSEPAVSVAWSVRGTLDIATTWRPGKLLTTVTRGDKVETVNAVITRRTWTRVTERGEGPNAGEVSYWVTSYDTQHLRPGLEAMV